MAWFSLLTPSTRPYLPVPSTSCEMVAPMVNTLIYCIYLIILHAAALYNILYNSKLFFFNWKRPKIDVRADVIHGHSIIKSTWPSVRQNYIMHICAFIVECKVCNIVKRISLYSNKKEWLFRQFYNVVPQQAKLGSLALIWRKSMKERLLSP